MIDAAADWHTHSLTSDGQDSLQAMADAGAAAGLHTLGLSDHVRVSTTWLPEYVREVRALRVDGLTIRCGVEVKMLDTSGRLDLPLRTPELDYLLVADHQFPGPTGPMLPGEVSDLIRSGHKTRGDVLNDVVEATASALRRSPYPPIVAHLFSLLPKCGLTETEITDDLLDHLASACLDTGGRVEVNEKWRCPSPRVLTYLAGRGVVLTAGSDAHAAVDVGQWSYLHDVEQVCAGDTDA